MLHLTLKSEYSFGECYGFLKKLHDEYSEDGAIGIADNNTFSFYKLQKLCEKSGVKPIFGYRCTVVENAVEKVKPRGQFGNPYIIIAKNAKGIREIFRLTKLMSENFYYRGNVSVSDVESLTKNVFVISTNPITRRLDYIGIGFNTPPKIAKMDFPRIFVDENYYNSGKDKKVYQLYAGRNSNDKSCPQKVLTQEEAIHYFGKDCVDELVILASQVETFDLPLADNVKYKGSDTIVEKSRLGAITLGIDLDDSVYKERYNKEINLIESKGYSDYLMVVSEIIQEAKKYALMGSGRGSSGGSLICYLLGITTFDPIPYGLVFERFIDINRYDPPDVDFDVPDKYRGKVVKWMEKRYGIDNVKTISNITKFKPKSAIGEFAKAMDIPRFETEAVKDAIIARAAGDARAAFALQDTFENTEVGKEFLKKFPQMKNVTQIENHARNKGKHAAGVIICNQPLTDYCGVDERDGTVYLDKRDAEALNLLKVDTLGLRTLSVLQDCARSIGMDYKDYYSLPLDDEKAYKVFKDKRLGGVFQFEGEAVKSINDSSPMAKFEDIVAAGALGRPGALSSGGTSRYVQLKNGKREPLYYCDKHKKITEETFGIVVYQEMMMALCREIAGMSWEDVSSLRKAASKSLGEEFFDQYRVKFVEGAIKLSGYDSETANKAWLDISSMGCLSGDTLIIGNTSKEGVKISDLYTNRTKNDRVLMVCKDGKIRPKKLTDIYKSGLKTTYLLTVVDKNKNIKKIRATMDHKFMIDGMEFKKLSDLSIGEYVVVRGYYNYCEQELGRIISIKDPRTEMTYDIAMPEPNNFIANGFAVHNSYAFNKSHSVAYGYISYWCIHGQSKLFDWDKKAFVTIAKAFKDGVDNIACYDEKLKKTIKGKVKKIIRTTGAKNKDLKKSIKIKLKNRRKIICSHDHKILTNKGYVRAIDIKLQDMVLCEKLCIDITDSLKEKRSKSMKARWNSDEKESLNKYRASATLQSSKGENHYCHYKHMTEEEKERHKNNFVKNVNPLASQSNIGRDMYTMASGAKTNSFFEYLFEQVLIDMNVEYKWQKLVDNKQYSKGCHQFSDFFINGVYIELELNKRDIKYYNDKYCCGENYIILDKKTNIDKMKSVIEECVLIDEIINGRDIVESEVVSITNEKDCVMYDVVMEDEPHNYLADNIVVHNCAYMKAHHPLEFIAAILNNAKDDDSSLKILREFYETENLDFKAIDTRHSNVKWEIVNGKLIGGLTNIKGVGVVKAANIISARNGTKPFTAGLLNIMENPKTPFDILYPCKHHFGDLYRNPTEYGLNKISLISEVEAAGEYAIIGKMIHIDDVDVNDVQSIAKRGGEVLDGPNMKVHIRLEDDSGVMMCIVGRFIYNQIAQSFLKEKVGSTWYCLTGKVMSGTKILFVKNVANLNQQVGLNESDEMR